MAQAISVVVTGVSYDDNILSMVVRENRDLYRGTHDVVMNSIASVTGVNVSEENTYTHISQAIYDARMKGTAYIVLEGNAGNEYHVYLRTGDEKYLIDNY